MPHARYVEPAGCGHCPQLEEPEAFTELLLGFQARARPQGVSSPSDAGLARCPMNCPEQTQPAAVANGYDMVFRGGVADLRRTPARIIDEAPKRVVYRYLPQHDEPQRDLPVLFVPPLAAPTMSFDLRRGCSMAEHFIAMGHPTYLVEYGAIAFSDRDLGLEFWVRDVLPNAIRTVSEDAGGKPVQLLGWCLGGIMALLRSPATASLPSPPSPPSRARSTSRRCPWPRRCGGEQRHERLPRQRDYRTFGGAPAPLVKWAFQLTSIDKYLTKPLAIATHLDDRDFLAQIEAVDHFMAHMHAYPGGRWASSTTASSA